MLTSQRLSSATHRSQQTKQSITNNNNNNNSNKHVTGGSLSKDERRMVWTAKEEFNNKGGFIRVYPSPESWELYRDDCFCCDCFSFVIYFNVGLSRDKPCKNFRVKFESSSVY